VQVAESRVFALSASGRVYVMPAHAAARQQNLAPSRWGTSWLWGSGEEAGSHYSEIIPAQKFGWGER
jgi:hypothetical protein